MLLSMFRPALRRVNRLGIPISSPGLSVPQLRQRRQYVASSPEPESPAASKAQKATPKAPEAPKAPGPTTSPELPTAPKPTQFSYDRKKNLPILRPLPAAPPEPLTTPLVESDFPVYLKPLYTRGWTLAACRMPMEHGKETPRVGFALSQTFRFPSTKDLAAFSKTTRDMNVQFGRILFRKTPKEPNIKFIASLLAPELTRGLVHLAIALETEHKTVVGGDFAVWTKQTWVRTLQRAQKILSDYQPGPRLLAELAPITPVALPLAPPAPVSSPPPITEADLETYIKPLVTNGWSVRGFSMSMAALGDHPALHRIYSFHDYASARDFLDTVISIIPAPTLHSYPWVGLWLESEKPAVAVWSISELAEGAPKKYGISYTDVRFAIEVESEFAKNWAGRAQNTAALARTLPKTMEELWNGEGKIE
ncbi:hypothetical protein C8R44DRAFT_763273 [Mycena epipterygia]|nr:hypothetical protein C8R44DRAFT_763273 [Mycena epipterygia]